MELTPKQQTVELIRNATKILVVTRTGVDGDAIGSVLALAAALKKLDKDVVGAIPEDVPQLYRFLPGVDQLSHEVGGTKDFIIELDTSRVKVAKMGYKKLEDQKKVQIIITPDRSTFREDDIRFETGPAQFDLILAVDTPSIDRFGDVFNTQAELFYETPLINIDHHPENESYGKVNWVDLTATSTAEILVALFESLGREQTLLDEDIATCLLTGITADTDSFQNASTTPKSLTVAAQLVAAGARQQDIIQSLYRRKTLSTLKLWGLVLTRIAEEKPARFLWSYVTQKDFETTGAERADVSGVADELLKTATDIDFALLFVEESLGVRGVLRSAKRTVDVTALARPWNGYGQPHAANFFMKDQDLKAVQETVLGAFKSRQEPKGS